MTIKDLKVSFEKLKQNVLKTEGQKPASEINNVITYINTYIAEGDNEQRKKTAVEKIYKAIANIEKLIKQSENIADLHSLIRQLRDVLK